LKHIIRSPPEKLAQGRSIDYLTKEESNLHRRATKVPISFNALSDMSGGRMVPVPGGVLIRSDRGDILGSVGISGDASGIDEICAVYGIQSVGLTPDTGDPL
jgi:uncharacterized protein GlcG (DUF336 family)